jgi:hypothetical protein
MSELPMSLLQSPVGSDGHLDERIDESIDESFPASDPPAVSLSDEPPRSPRIDPLPEDQSKAPRRGRTATLLTVVPVVLSLGGVALARYLRRRRSDRLQ